MKYFVFCCKNNKRINTSMIHLEIIHSSGIYNNVIQPFCQWSINIHHLILEVKDYIEHYYTYEQKISNEKKNNLINSIFASFIYQNNLELLSLLEKDLNTFRLSFQQVYSQQYGKIQINLHYNYFLLFDANHIENLIKPSDSYYYTHNKKVRIQLHGSDVLIVIGIYEKVYEFLKTQNYYLK